MKKEYANLVIDFAQKVYPWTEFKNIFIRGYAFRGDALLKGEQLAQHFHNVDAHSFKGKLCELNGFFSVVVVNQESVLAAVDHLRSMPLFYTKTEGRWCITDRLPVDEIIRRGIDGKSYNQFSFALSVTGKDTVCKDFYQIEAGEMIILSSGETHHDYWWQYAYAREFIEEESAAMTHIEKGYLETFQRLIAVLDGRTAVIPLSGGHDSRLIAFYLKKLGYEKIIAYSYGRRENAESAIAEQVASCLGIPFFFVEYERKAARKWAEQKLNGYLDFAGNGCSIPHFQDAYAVEQLCSRGLIPEDAVFIPGHTGDFIAGGHLLQRFFEKEEFTAEELYQAVLEKHFWANAHLQDKDRTHVKQSISELPYLRGYGSTLSAKEIAEAHERFDLMERQAKFILNSVRVYEYYGHEWLAPEFEIAQCQYWTQVGLPLRLNRALYMKYTQKLYPEELRAIPYAKGGFVKNLKYYISQLSIFPWTYVAHYMFIFVSIPEYFASVYIERNRSFNHWTFSRYKKMFQEKHIS